MRQKVKRYSRSAISILLTLCMIMSCMTVGIIATDAAKVSADEAVGANGFIKGSWDNWQQHDFTYEVSLPANTSYRFDVYKSSGQQCANDGVKISGTTQYTANNNNNGSMILETGAAGTYKFTYVSDDSGSMTFKVEFPSVTVSSVTAVGDSTALFGTAWAPTATANDMTNSGTTWSKTWTNVSLPAGTIQYKVALNHSWDITYPTDNKSQTVSSAGIYDVTVTYNSSDNAVSMTLTNKTPHKFELAATENAVVKASYNSTTIQEGGEFASVPQGETITVTVTPDVGYKIQSINATNGGTVTGSGNTRTVTMPNADTKVTVTMVGVGKRTVYFNNNNTKYAMVTAKYTYNGETVTSTMTKLSNSNIWSIEVPGDLTEITFIGDNGYNTGTLTIPDTSTFNPPMYTAPFNAQAPTIANGGTWGKYNERSNVYTVSKGTTLNDTTNLFTGISATFYDYYTDGEISTDWINGIGAKEYSRHNGSKFTWNPFTKLNSAISDYSSASKNNVWRPLYFGNLNVTSGNGTTLSIDTDGNSSSAVIKAYTGWNQDVNNSIGLSPASKAITDLSGQTLAGSTIHYYKNGATNENGAPMAIFDEDFLSGLNNQNKALASILRSPAFPVRKTTKSDHTYYEFDSTNGTDNAYFTTIDKTNKTAVLDYYAASANKTVASSTPSGTSKGFFPFDYGNIQNNTSDLWSTDYIYLDVSNTTGGSSWWACFRNNSTDSYSYVQMEHVSGNLYRCLNPDWASKVAFTKNSNNNQPSGNWGDGNNVYNYISDVSVPTGNNQNIMFKTSGYSGQAINGSWQAPAAQYLSHRAHDLGFGAKLEIPFTLEAGGEFSDGTPQVFEFSGDDDLWVFIDNKLVLDLGGAHTRAQGSINFKNETVSVTTGQQKADDEANNRNESFASWFDNSNPNQPHTMTIYYLERGMYDSNLKFGFSFHPIPNQFTAEKKVRTANINGGFYTINSNTQSQNMTLDGGRAITQFEETYQNEDFEITHKVGGSLIGALNYTLTEKDDHQATGTKTSSNTVANGKYTIQNDDLATFVNNLTKNAIFNLTESFPVSNKYKYTPSIEVYDDGHNKQLFTAVNTTPSAAGQVQKVDEGSYAFKFSETNPITGMENLNIRARFINQMNSHDLTIKKETNDPTDTTTTFNLKVLFKFGDYDYTPYPLTCTLNGVDTALAADGSIAVKNGDTIIIPKVPENANVRIIEVLDDTTSAYSYVGTDVKYSDGTTFGGNVTDSLTAKQVDFAIGTKDTTAIVNNHKCYLSTNHTLYNSPIGSGNTYTTVTVKDADDGTVATYPKTSGMITVDPLYIKASSTNKLEIVLETVPNSGYKFDEFYENITGTMKKLAASTSYYTANFDSSGTKVTVTVPVSALFANNEQAYTLLPFYSKLSIPEKTLTINKTVDVAADGEDSFDVKVEYFDGSDWVAYDDEENATDSSGIGTVSAGTPLVVTLKGVAAMNKVRVTEIPKPGTKYQAPVYALTSGGTEDTSYTGNGIAFTSTLAQNPVVGITNNIKRQNFTITKKIDVASDPAGTFTFMVNLNGSAIPDTYQYQIGNGTAQNFSGGVATMTGSVSGTTMTVLNIPVGASIEVYESNSGAGYDLNSVSFTTGTGTINNNRATFTVTDGTTHALEFTNYKKQTVTIKKELVAGDTDVDDPATAFKFKITVDGQAYTSSVKLDNADYSPVGGVYELKRDQTITLSNIARGAVVNVVEVDHINDYYEYVNTTVTGATMQSPDAIDDSTDGAKFTVGSQPVAVVVTNKARRVDVVINKKTDFPVDDGSEFVIDVKSRQRNSQNNNPVANISGTVSTGSTNNNDGTYNLKKDGTITFTNVPKGTYFIVNETSQGTYSPINGARFTKQSIHAYPTSTASNPQYIQVRDDSQNLTDELTARSVPMTDNTTFVVSNIVKRNDLIIAKTISDATDRNTEHTLTVVLKQSATGDPYTGLTYQYKRHGDADWSAAQSFTSGGTIKIHQDEWIKFSGVPVGSYISILETSPNGNYTLDKFTVTNFISGTLDTDSVTNQVSFLTADVSDATNVNITNKLQRFDLAVTKNTDSKVSDTFKVKVQTSDAQNGTYNDMVFDAAGQFTISDLTDAEAFNRYDTSTHEISLTKDQTLTVKNLAINSYVKVVETNAGEKHEWQNYTPATGTTIKNTVSSAADGAIVQMTADQALTINNKIKTQNVKITKITDFKDENQDFNFTVSIKRSGETSNDAINTYKYTPSGVITDTEGTTFFANTGTFTLKKDGSIVIYKVPVDATVTVTEATPDNGYSFNKSASSGATFTDAGVATLTVPNGTNPTVTFANTKDKTVTIKKTTDWNNTADEFTFNVKKNSDNYSGTAGTNYKVFNGSNVEQTRSFDASGNITLKKDEYVVIYGVKTNDTFQVNENAHSRYNIGSVTGKVTANNTAFTITDDNAEVVYNNTIKKHDVTIKKEITGSSDTETAFPITIKVTKVANDPANQTFTMTSSVTGTAAKTINEGTALTTATIRGNETLTIKDVPIGYTVEVEETDAQTGNFEFVSISAANTASTPTTDGRKVTFTTANSVAAVTITNKPIVRDIEITKSTDHGTGTFYVTAQLGSVFAANYQKKSSGGDYGTEQTVGNDHKIAIQPGETIKISNVAKNTAVTVKEVDIDSSFTYGSTTVSGATGNELTGSNHGTSFTMGTANVTVQVNNKQLHTLKLKKVTDIATAKNFTFNVYVWDTASNSYPANPTYTQTVSGTSAAHEFTVLTASGNPVKFTKGTKIKVVETVDADYNYTTSGSSVSGNAGTVTEEANGYSEIVFGDNDVEVTLKNLVVRRDVKISKEANYPATDFEFTVTGADGYDYQKYDSSAGTTSSGTNFAGTFTLDDGDYFVIKNVPVGTPLTVEESDAKEATTTAVTATGITYTSSDPTTRTYSFNVPNATNAELHFKNTKDKSLIISKVKPASDSDVDTSDKLFYISLTRKDGTEFTPTFEGVPNDRWDATNNRFAIKIGETIIVKNVNDNDEFNVAEVNIDENYTLNSVQVVGDNNAVAITNGKQVKIGATNVTVTFENQIKRGNVTITKNVIGLTGSTDNHTITIKKKTNGSSQTDWDASVTFTRSGQSNPETVANNATTTIKAGETLTITNVPVGTYFEVEETAPNAKYTCTGISVAGTSSKTENAPKATFTTQVEQATDTAAKTAAVTITNTVKTQNVTIEKVVTNSSSDYAFPIHVKVQPKGSSDDITGTYKYKVGNGSEQTKSDASTTDGLALNIQQGTAIQILEVPVGAQVIVEEDSLSGTNFTFEDIASTNAGGTKNGQAYTFTVADGTDPTVTITNSIKTRDVKIGKRVDTGSTATTFPIKVEVTQTKGTFTMPAGFTNNVKSFTHGAANDVTLTVPLDATVKVTEANDGIPAGFEFEKITLDGTDVSATGNSCTYTGNTSDTANKEILVHNTELHKLTVAKTVEGTDNTTDTFTFKAYKWDSSNSTWADEKTFTLTKGTSHDVFTNVRKGEKFKVVEVVPDKYTYDTTAAKTKVEGATGSAAFTDATNKTYGFQNIVMGTADVNVTINNIVKTKTVKISKRTNYTETQNSGAFGFNVKTKADGAAAGTEFTNCTYKYKINGTGAEQTFNNGNFTLTNGQFITIENVPVDTQFEVTETEPLSATSTTETYTGLTADSNLTDKTAHFTVSTDDNQEVNFFNSKNKTLKIKKTKPAADSDINDTTTSFYISVRKYNTDTSAYVPYNGNVGTDYNATSGVTLANGVFTLKMDGEVTINVNDGEEYEVKEINIDSKYTLSDVTGGDEDVMDGSNKVGRSATIGTENVEITFTNQIKRHNVIVQKAYSSGDSNTAKHTVVVTVRPNGQSSEVGKTENTETQFKKGTNYVVSNVPAGAYVTVQETACATGYVLDNISDDAFTMPADADKTVTVTNKLDKYNLDIVKTVNDNVADTYTVKIYQSDTGAENSWTEVTSGVKKGNDTVAYNNGFAIEKGNDNKLTLTDIDYGKYIKVVETNAGTKHHWTAYTGGTTNGTTQAAGVITQVTATGQSVGITNAVNTHKVTITKALTNSNNSTAKFKISATVNGEITWTRSIAGTAAANNSLTDMEITAGQTIELLDVPVDAVVNVSEPTDTTGFSFVSATYSITGSSTTGHNVDGQKNVTFTMEDYDATVTVNNKINDKTITVKKVTDSGDGSDFKVKVEYQLSNATSDTWTPYVNTTAGFDNNGVVTLDNDGTATVSIPSDAQVKVTEVIANMPSGYAFESITLNSDATTYDNGKVAAVADTNIITVHNTKLRNVNITKTTDVSTDTATEFKITVEKSTDGNTWSYVTTLKKGSDIVNASENKFVIKKGETLTLEGVRKGTQIRVTETDTTDSYTFSASGSGVTDVNTAATINGDSKTIAFTVDKAADPTVTVDNDAVKKSFTIEKHVDVATDQNFTIRLRKKALGESTFTAYTGVGFDKNGQKTIQAGSEHAITISAQPVGTEFILEEITGSNPTGYNFTSVTLTGLTAITPSETVSDGQAFKVSTETTQKAVVNNTKSSQLIVTKAITGDTANKQFPIVIQKQNGDAIDSSKISVQNASGAELTNRTADGKVFMLSAGDKVIVNGVTQGEKYFVKENALSGTDYLGYRFDNYAITPNGTSSEDSNSGKLITIGGESVTVTVNNSLITRNIQIKKTVDYAYSNETSFPISVEYKDITDNNEWKTVTGAPTEIQARDTWTTVTLTGQAAVSEIRVTENLPSATHYGTPTLTVADATKEDGDSSATAVAFNFDVTKTPQVTIANHAKTAKVNVTKQLVDGNTTSAFEINVAYKTPGADNFVTETYSVVPGNTSADLVLPIGTIVKVTETADTVTGYELDSMQKKVGSAEATAYTADDEYTLTTDNVLFTVKNKLKTYTVTVNKVIENETTNTTTPFKVNVNSEEKEIRQGTAHSFTAKYGDTVTVSETDLPRGYELVNITNGSTTTPAGINSLETEVTGNTTITVTNTKLPTYEVTIRKDAEGEPGDTTFGITVSGTTNIPYSYQYYDSSNNAKTGTDAFGNVTDASKEFTLKHNESVKLSGLLAGDQLTIEETNAGTDYSFEKFVVNNVDNANAIITYTVKSDGNNIVVHNKPSAKYQYEIKYIYEGYTATTFNNDGSFKEGPQRFFIATGELTTDEWNEFVDTSQENTLNAGKADNFITKTAPHEDDFMMNLQFKSSEIKNVVVDKANKKVSFEVTATTTPERDVYVYFQLPYAVDENLVATGDTFIPYQQKDATTVYGHWVQKNGSFISAPLTLKDGSNTRYFQYWQIRSRTAESGRNKGKVETDYKRCYYADFNMTMYQDSYVTAVYTTAQTDYNPNAASYQDTKDGEAYINFIENSRNQWNSDGGGDGMTGDKLKAGDRVYSDFLVTYGYQDKQLNALGNSANVTTGLVVEQVAELDKDQYGDYKTKSQSEYHEATCYGSSETAAKTQVVNFVKTGAATGVPVKDEITSKFIANQTVQLKNLDNKNQAKYSLNLLNKAYGTNTPSDKYKIYVFRAYSYIRVGNNVVVSDPTYFTIYDIASIEPKG